MSFLSSYEFFSLFCLSCGSALRSSCFFFSPDGLSVLVSTSVVVHAVSWSALFSSSLFLFLSMLMFCFSFPSLYVLSLGLPVPLCFSLFSSSFLVWFLALFLCSHLPLCLSSRGALSVCTQGQISQSLFSRFFIFLLSLFPCFLCVIFLYFVLHLLLLFLSLLLCHAPVFIYVAVFVVMWSALYVHSKTELTDH